MNEETINTQAESKKKEKEKKQKGPFVVILLLIIIIILLLLHSCDGRGGTDDTIGHVGTAGEIAMMDPDELQARVDETVEQGMFQVFMNTEVDIDSDNNMDLMIQNSQNNHYDCIVRIYMDDEEIYHSGIISPGYKLESDVLDKELEPGSYPCKAAFCVLNEDGTEFNQVGLKITLVKK